MSDASHENAQRDISLNTSVMVNRCVFTSRGFCYEKVVIRLSIWRFLYNKILGNIQFTAVAVTASDRKSVEAIL